MGVLHLASEPERFSGEAKWFRPYLGYYQGLHKARCDYNSLSSDVLSGYAFGSVLGVALFAFWLLLNIHAYGNLVDISEDQS